MITVRAVTPIAILFLASTASTTLYAQNASGTANFGNVTSDANSSVCFNGPNDANYYPSSGSAAGFSTPGGNVSIQLTQIHPGQICLPAQFTQGSVDGAITGSTNVTFNSESNAGETYTVNFSSTGQSTIVAAMAGPKYQILSILYTPPGDHSNSGFSNSVSEGATNTIGSNFSSSDTISVTGGVGSVVGVSGGASFSTASSSTTSNAYTVSASASSGSQLANSAQAINHDNDQIFLWINPAIHIQQTGSTTGNFTLGTIDSSGNYNSGAPMDIVNVNLAGLKNPSLIPLSVLEAQNPKPGVTLPGLSYVCANPLPQNQCTQQNACGCVPSDFASIVAQDELNNVASESTQPNAVDQNRYVYVTYETLEGPQQSGAGPVSNTFSLTDSNMSAQTYGTGSSYTVGFSTGFSYKGPFSLSITNTQNWTYGQTESSGSSNGTAHTGSVTIGSDKVGCQEYVDVYEDTIYHTFAYALSQPAPPNCQ